MRSIAWRKKQTLNLLSNGNTMVSKTNLYIPREIRSCILENMAIKKNLYRYVYSQLSKHYSIFSTSDYFQMVKRVINNTGEYEESESYPREYYDNLESKWLERMENEFKKFLVEGIDGYSKIVLILSIMENIKNKSILQNKFFLTSCKGYDSIWRKNKPHSIRSVPNFYKVIITLKESSFYKIKLVEGGALSVSAQKMRIWDKETALDYIDYSYLDDELFDLLFRDSFRFKLQNIIIIYIRAFDMID